MLSFLLLLFSQVVGSLYSKCDVVQFSVGVKASLVESQQMSRFPFMFLSLCFRAPFNWISFCINSLYVPFILFFPFVFLVCSFHVLFTWHSCPFIFRRYVSNIQGLRKVICSNQSGGYPRKASCVHHISLSFSLSCRYRFGGLCRLPSSGFMNMHMYKCVIVLLYSFRFLGPVMHW